MTDYCTVSDIEARLKGMTFSTSTVITTAQCGDFITTNSAVIDGRLNAVYEIPITGTSSLAIVKKICIYMTLAEVKDILNDGIGKEDEEEKDYLAIANSMLDKLEAGELELTDATAKTSNDFYNYNVENSKEAVVEKDETQW